MAIKLKTKIALGGFFLFVLLLLVGAVSYYYFNRITAGSKNILTDNYETLALANDMLRALDDTTAGNDSALGIFEHTLRLQEENITESGEKEMTASLRNHYRAFLQNRHDSLELAIRKDINAIMQVNLDAIDKKNQLTNKAVENAKTIIAVILTVCLLLGFSFLLNFPSLVASPIAKLTEGIKAIANKNYGQRVQLDRKDEFGELAEAFNSMAERLDEYEHSNLSKILFEKQRAETVINSLKDASIGIDNKGRVLFANRQALQLLNLKEQDIIALPQDDVKKKNDLFRFLIQEQGSAPFKIVVAGKENYFTKELIELSDENQKAGYVIVVKNITPFKELDVAKTNFIATISHELKTPLASADFSLKLLEDERVGKLTPEQKQLVENLKEDNRRLLRILSELLDMSQVESGKIQLNLEEVVPARLVEKALESVRNVAKEKNITIRRQIPSNLPLTEADAEKTTWVLNNLLTNAIRYSPENGEMIVAIRSLDDKIEFSVQDFGIGIDPKYRDRVFDRYFRVPGTREGTGLGLAISKDFIEAQDGSIFVESEPGKGSRFGFLLPLNRKIKDE